MKIKKITIKEDINNIDTQFFILEVTDFNSSETMFLMIHINDESKKDYIDRIKNLETEIVQELYNYKELLTGKARLVISRTEYENYKREILND